MVKYAAIIATLCCAFIIHANAQTYPSISRPSTWDNWDAGSSGYIYWSGGATYVSISYKYSSSSSWSTIISPLSNGQSYYWSIPTYVSGNVQIRVCNYGSTTQCDTSTSVWVYSYNNTIYISPAAWVVPTIFAICLIIGIISCQRRKTCCFANRGTDVYVPVTGAYVQPQQDVYVVQQQQPVVYAQPAGQVAYQQAPAQVYYPQQGQQQVYQQPYYQPQ